MFNLESPDQNHVRSLFDLLVIGLVVAILTAIHYTNYHYEMNYHILLQFAYYLPVIYAAMRFGLAGGILSGLVITLLILPFMTHFHAMDLSAIYTQWVEIGLINVIGWLHRILDPTREAGKTQISTGFNGSKGIGGEVKARRSGARTPGGGDPTNRTFNGSWAYECRIGS